MARHDRAHTTRRRPARPPAVLDDTDEHGGFLATYADLVTLLLAFFVMLYGMSDTDPRKFSGAAASLRQALGAGDARRARDSQPDRPKEDALTNRSLETLHETLSAQLSGHPVRLQRNGRRLRIQVDDSALFRSGSAELVGRAEPLFRALTLALRQHDDYRIHIEGHTDNQPISTPRYPSNWELSAIRATTVLRMLIDLGLDPTRLTATGYGDLLPLLPNDNDEHRARNRRVELVLETETKR